jgi:uncharacterized protein (TIGR03083 family)
MVMTESTFDLDHVMAVLRASQGRLATAVASMDDAQVSGPSYDAEWSIAQVLSHLGSGSEIFGQYVVAGRDGTPPPDIAVFQPIWDRWNAKPPVVAVHDGVAADAEFIDLVDSLNEGIAASWRLEMFGESRDLVEVVSMRLTEHAIHTWDVVVMNDPSATVSADAVDLIIDRLDLIAQYTAQPSPQDLDVAVSAEAPGREFRLRSTTDAVTLRAPADGPAPATLKLPAEAFVRLVYGRLDDEHADGVTASGVSLDAIRAVFPGP